MCGKRWGLLFSAFFTRKILRAADRRDFELEKAGFLHGRGPDARSVGKMPIPRSPQKITKQLQRHASKRRPSTSPDGNAHRFRTPQSAEQQPCNLPNPESAGKIIGSSSLLRNRRCLACGGQRAGPSPRNFPTNKIFLPHIPRLGAEVFHPSHSHRPARPGPAQPFSLLIKPPIAGRKILG